MQAVSQCVRVSLTQCEWRCIHHVRPATLHNAFKFCLLNEQRPAQLLHSRDQLLDQFLWHENYSSVVYSFIFIFNPLPSTVTHFLTCIDTHNPIFLNYILTISLDLKFGLLVIQTVAVAICIAVGKVSFDDWLQFTWSFGWTGFFDPITPPTTGWCNISLNKITMAYFYLFDIRYKWLSDWRKMDLIKSHSHPLIVHPHPDIEKHQIKILAGMAKKVKCCSGEFWMTRTTILS